MQWKNNNFLVRNITSSHSKVNQTKESFVNLNFDMSLWTKPLISRSFVHNKQKFKF